MNMGQGEQLYTEDFGFLDLVSEPPAELVAYQPTAPTAGATPSFLDQMVSMTQKLIPAALSFKQQNDLNQLNLERARKGLPPLNTSQFMAQSAPQVRVGMTQDTQKMVMIGLAGVAVLAAFFIFSRK